MKHILLISISVFLFSQCKKDIPQTIAKETIAEETQECSGLICSWKLDRIEFSAWDLPLPDTTYYAECYLEFYADSTYILTFDSRSYEGACFQYSNGWYTMLSRNDFPNLYLCRQCFLEERGYFKLDDSGKLVIHNTFSCGKMHCDFIFSRIAQVPKPPSPPITP